MGVAVLGLALAVLGSGDVGSLSLLGIGLAVLTMIAYSATVLMAGRPKTDLPPLVRTGTGLGIAAFVWLVMVPPWTLPFDLLDETTTFDGRVGFSLPVWVAVVFVVVVGTVAVYATWVAGTSLVGAGAASVVGMAEPMLGASSPGRSSRRASRPSRASGSQRPRAGSSWSSRRGCGRRETASATFRSISDVPRSPGSGAVGSCCPIELELTELDAADLPRQRLRQIGDELDQARIGVGREPLADEGLDLGGELVRRRVALGEDDERLDDVAAQLVG